MTALPRLLIAASLCLLAAGTAHAATIGRVEVRGLDEAMERNVRTALSAVDAIGRETSGRRVGYLLREAERETREALEPFGYYSPTITVERTRDGVTTVVDDGPAAPAPGEPTSSELTSSGSAASEPASPDPAASGRGAGDDAGEAPDARAPNTSPITVTITVQLGEPVTVRRADVGIDGEGSGDRYLREDLAAFEPEVGAVFDHALYEASKTRISRRLAERGYFDADFLTRRVEVTRAERAADIDLRWSSGPRYDMGEITIVQSPRRVLRPGIVDQLVYWEQGSYYHQGKLDRFRESLAKLDYFSGIDIVPRPEDAVAGQVPIDVTLTPAKRSIYTAGLSYGTDSGAGVRLGVERRYVNDRGHKALAQVDYAQKRRTGTLQYRIPAFAWLDGWYTVSAQYLDEDTDYLDTVSTRLVLARSGQLSRWLTATVSLNALRERWSYPAVDDDGDPATPAPVERFQTTFVYPALRAEYIKADDRIFPRDGLGLSGELRGGLDGAGSDANFLQSHLIGRWYRGLGTRNRLIVRGEVGSTWTNALVDMPPSLRFFAGGDRSIRGYGYREVGPTAIGEDGKKYALGARNVLTGSAEFERYFNDSWGAAAFVDAGDAFDDVPEAKVGVGIGARWRSPVGPVRIDIARGLDDPDSAFEIYLNIGADW